MPWPNGSTRTSSTPGSCTGHSPSPRWSGGSPSARALPLAELVAGCRIEVERASPDQTDRLETVLLDGRDVTLDVRAPRVDRAVSAVSRHPEVRDAMVGVQRAAARRGKRRHGRPGHRHRGPAGRDAQGLPHRRSRGARGPPGRGDGPPRSASTRTWRRSAAATPPTRVAPSRRCESRTARSCSTRASSDVDDVRRCHRGGARAGRCVAGSTIPAAAIAGFLARLLFRARVEGVEHLPRAGPLHPGRRTIARTSTRRSWAGRPGTRSVASSTSWPRSRCGAGRSSAGWRRSPASTSCAAARAIARAQRFSMEALADGPPDRAVRRGHALARRSPEGRQARRRPPRHALGRAAHAGRDRRHAPHLSRADRAGRTRRASWCASASRSRWRTSPTAASTGRRSPKGPIGSCERSRRSCRRSSDRTG